MHRFKAVLNAPLQGGAQCTASRLSGTIDDVR
jgi:hypothetical protein